MKKLLVMLVLLPVLALIIAVSCGVPVLDWVAKLFKVISSMFGSVAQFCSWLQNIINLGVIR